MCISKASRAWLLRLLSLHHLPLTPSHPHTHPHSHASALPRVHPQTRPRCPGGVGCPTTRSRLGVPTTATAPPCTASGAKTAPGSPPRSRIRSQESLKMHRFLMHFSGFLRSGGKRGRPESLNMLGFSCILLSGGEALAGGQVMFVGWAKRIRFALILATLL